TDGSGHDRLLNPDIDAAAQARRPLILLGLQGSCLINVDSGRRIALRIRLRLIAAVERAVGRLLPERKFESAVGSLETGLLQRALKPLRVAAQEIERLRPIDGEMRVHLPAL